MPRSTVILLVLVLVLAGAIVLRMNVGGELGSFTDEARAAVLELRAWRVLLAGVVGASLGMAGVVLQGLLRNSLASPDVLGPASGASLAVMLSAWLMPAAATTGFGALAWQAGPALLGSLIVLGVIFSLSRGRRGLDPAGLIIVGAVISVMCGAGVVFVQHLINASSISGRSLTLLVGSISDDTPRLHTMVVGAMAVVSMVVACIIGRASDAAAMSDDEAISVGVHLRGLRVMQFVLAGVLTAGAVVLAGPVGFIGLICPHAVRLMLDAQRAGASGTERINGRFGLSTLVGRTGVLVIGSALFGAALLMFADAGVRAINLGSGRMPIGVLTALLGGPVLIALLRRRSIMQ